MCASLSVLQGEFALFVCFLCHVVVADRYTMKRLLQQTGTRKVWQWKLILTMLREALARKYHSSLCMHIYYVSMIHRILWKICVLFRLLLSPYLSLSLSLCLNLKVHIYMKHTLIKRIANSNLL